MKRFLYLVLYLVVLVLPSSAVFAQGSAFPLPADLYILTSERELIRVDRYSGEQTVISSPDQPVLDFDIAPDGSWYVYRTMLNSAVIVSALNNQSGFVLEFDSPLPVSIAPGVTSIAWSPDAASIAYLIPGGIRIADLRPDETGNFIFNNVSGNWISLYWLDPSTIIAQQESGGFDQISRQPDQPWVVQPAGENPQAESGGPMPSLAPAQGVILENGLVVPGTAGAIQFDWGAMPPAAASGTLLPADLFYAAPDVNGTAQIWLLGREGGTAQALTAESVPVLNFDMTPDGSQIAFATANTLTAVNRDGSNRRTLATLDVTCGSINLDWSPDAAQIAYSDGRGVWLVPSDGSAPPRAFLQNQGDPAHIDQIRNYFSPSWSADGAKLLVGVGYWEWGFLGVADVATGSITELTGRGMGPAIWTADGRVLTWNSQLGMEVPGLFLLDPAAPDAPPGVILDQTFPVEDVAIEGRVYALVGSAATMGPQYWRVLVADSVTGPYQILYGERSGGYAELPQLTAPSADGSRPAMIAGFRNMEYSDNGCTAGDLIVIDMSSGNVTQPETRGQTSRFQWGP